jgi:hypothetical protein
VRKALICCAFVALVAVAGAAGRPAKGPTCNAERVYPLVSPVQAYYAVARQGLRAYEAPDGAPLGTFGRLNVNEVPTVFGVVGARVAGNCRPAWYRVQLPMRPNGVTGYVRASLVSVGLVRIRVTVDLSDHQLVAYRDGKPVLRTTVAVGSPATPTPTGRFYVNQRLLVKDPTGPWGFGGIGISAFSDVLTGWTQGGPIGIHGTNQPWSIGRSVSNGCVRVPNGVLHRLWSFVVEGTPVIISP